MARSRKSAWAPFCYPLPGDPVHHHRPDGGEKTKNIPPARPTVIAAELAGSDPAGRIRDGEIDPEPDGGEIGKNMKIPPARST